MIRVAKNFSKRMKFVIVHDVTKCLNCGQSNPGRKKDPGKQSCTFVWFYLHIQKTNGTVQLSMPFQDAIICKIRNVLFRSSHIFVFWFLVDQNISHQICFLFLQLLKTSFNWENFCWLTNKKFIFSAKSKHKKNWQLIFWSFGSYLPKTKIENMRWTG